MRVSAICYAVLGLFEGVIFAAMFSFLPFAGPNTQNMPKFLGPIFGLGALIIFPLLFAAMGAIAGGLGAVVYNLTAHFVGGIEVEVE